jgi:hypothetical protein
MPASSSAQLAVELLDPAGERGQSCLGGTQHRVALARRAQAGRLVGQRTDAQAAQTGPQLVGAGDEQFSHLDERARPGRARRALGHEEGPDRLDRTVFGLGNALGLATERRSGGLDGIEGVGLATASTFLSIRSVDLDDADAGPGQELGEARPIRTGAFDAHLGHFPVGLEPTQERLVARRRGWERCGAEQGADAV